MVTCLASSSYGIQKIPHLPLLASADAQSSISFAVIGDFGSGGKSEAAVAALIKSWNPDLIITIGDNNYPAGSALSMDWNVGQFYHGYIYPYKGFFGAGAAINRFFPVLGNHDWMASRAAPYQGYFTLPGNGRYYDFAWGPVHFFALDSDDQEPDRTTFQSRQAQWLKSALAAAPEPWKVVYFHHPPYSSGSAHGSDVNMQWPFRVWGATVVLSGHEHLYERIMKAGFPYFVNGAGGAGLYDFSDRPVDGSVIRYNQDWGAIDVKADFHQIQFQFITEKNVVIDSLQLFWSDRGASPYFSSRRWVPICSFTLSPGDDSKCIYHLAPAAPY